MPAEAGRLFNNLRDLAVMQTGLPVVKRSVKPKDDFVLTLAQALAACHVVTGDKSGLLMLRQHAGADVVTSTNFIKKYLNQGPNVCVVLVLYAQAAMN